LRVRLAPTAVKVCVWGAKNVIGGAVLPFEGNHPSWPRLRRGYGGLRRGRPAPIASSWPCPVRSLQSFPSRQGHSAKARTAAHGNAA